MHKIVALLVLISSTVKSFGQPQFGVFGGPQMITTSYKIYSEKQPGTAKYGFHLGAMAKVPFDNQLFFAPQAFYSLKGYKVRFNQSAFPPDTNAVNNNTTIHTFELAFLLQFDFNNQPDHFFVKLGPSLDFQLFGKEKFDLKNGTAADQKMIFDFGNYGRYAANILLQFGYEISNSFLISANYTHGIGNLNNHDGGPSIRYRGFGLSVGKYFGKKMVMDTRNKE
jgi:hypothetical protein